MSVNEKLVVTISDNNITSFVYDDKLSDFFNEGESLTVRATHCEPCADGRWAIDLGPSGGPVIFGFPTKTEALAVEKQWLEENVL